MAKVVSGYECEFCGKYYKTKTGVTNHEKKCPKNPIFNQQEREKEKVQEEVDKIRDEATSPEHLVQLLESFALKYGIELVFSNYPSRYNKNISNTHEAPQGYPKNWDRDDKLPSGYPGFDGRWAGRIKIVDESKLPSYFKTSSNFGFSDFTGHWSGGVCNIPFIHTGSGSGGENFGYYGIIFIYDFPKMHQDFKDNGGEFEVLEDECQQSIQNYYKKFKDSREEYIEADNIIKQINYYQEKIKKFKGDLNSAYSKMHQHLTNKYNEEHAKPLPLPKNMFNNNETIKRIHCDMSYTSASVDPKLESLFERVKYYADSIERYKEVNPEIFI